MAASDSTSGRFRHLRILLLEDNYLVGLSLKLLLERLGCRVVGPLATLSDAQRALARDEIDGAVLDINIIGGTSAAVADVLEDRGMPYFFITGYQSPDMLPERLVSVPRLQKPVDPVRLESALVDVFLDR